MTASPPRSRQAVLGFGGNVGDVCSHFRAAHQALSALGITPLACSQLYQTRAWVLPGHAPQASYCNAAVLIASELSAEALVASCHALAQTFGARQGPPGQAWQARALDIDVIAIEGVQVDVPHCRVPHPAMPMRPFVLWPLADLAGDWPLGPHRRVAGDYLAKLARADEGILSRQLTWCSIR